MIKYMDLLQNSTFINVFILIWIIYNSLEQTYLCQ